MMRVGLPSILTALLIFLAGVTQGQSLKEPAVDSEQWSDQYDDYFRTYSNLYFGPFFDWRWFKAQAIAESNLDPNIESEVGALGLMQIMPATYAEIRELNPHFKEIRSPRWNIAAGIYYNRHIFRKWTFPSETERLLHTFASYNAGYVRVLRAVKRSGGKSSTWEKTRHFVPSQTRYYVQRIRDLMDQEPYQPQRLRGLNELFSFNLQSAPDT